MSSSSSLSFTSSSLHVVGSTTDVLGVCETVMLVVVQLVVEELTLDKLDTVGIVSVEHTGRATEEGKAAPLLRGGGRIGFAAIPSI